MSFKSVMSEKNINVIWKDEIEPAGSAHARKLLADIGDMMTCPPKNAYLQLKKWRDIGCRMQAYIVAMSKFSGKVYEDNQKLKKDISNNANKRWSKEEDELLIEMVCDSSTSIFEISTTLGRTPAAIKSRVSALVGMSRISSEIAGVFIGTLNGVETQGQINGTVYKDSKKEAEDAENV